MNTKIFLFFVAQASLFAGGLVLKPLNPYPIADDTFMVKLSLENAVPMSVLEPWVTTEDGFTRNRFIEFESAFAVGQSRNVPIRLFLVRQGARFSDIVRDIRALRAMGFRYTTLRHIVALSNGSDLRKLNPDVVVLASTPPYLRLDNDMIGEVSDALIGALITRQGIKIGFIGDRTLPTFRAVLVAFEPPLGTY
ncbi:MAG: hypothetical protein WC767_00245 [Candidatus Paceibacterota bacterium]